MIGADADFQEAITWGYRMILGTEPKPDLVTWQAKMIEPKTQEEVRTRLMRELPKAVPDVNVLLHKARSALLRQIPKGAHTFLSAGCAGLWFFEWIEQCYGHTPVHIGLEYYMPKPEGLPANVNWIANTCSDMSDVASASADLVFSGQNFEHLWPDELLGFMLEAARVTKEGGLLVMDSPNRSITEAIGTWSHPEHTVEATVAEAIEIAELAGFDVTITKGVWLMRDPVTKAVLPFMPVESEQWSVPERLIVATDNPEDAFIWWVEARRSSRGPQTEKLRAAVFGIYNRAWPERLTRMGSLVGTEEMRDGERWISTETAEEGFLIFGPYAPLRQGSYSVEFHLFSAENDGAGADVICDVVDLLGSIVFTSAPARVNGKTVVVLDFSLDKLEFGMQFRCRALGTRRISCRRRVTLIEHN